jgi:uncharacterized protein (DUF1015 family)
MPLLRPFRAYRPKPEFAGEVAAKPYDILSSDEARQEVKGHPYSFLHVGKPEVDLDPSIDLHDPRVYQIGKENLDALIANGILVPDSHPALYIYAQTMNGRTQYGIVGCVSVEEYWDGTIKKHELTRKDKEVDRSNHVRITRSHSGPVFLTYKDDATIDGVVSTIVGQPPVNDHIAADGVRHRTWIIEDTQTLTVLQKHFAAIPHFYIADGHHRSAAAATIGRERKDANPNHRGDEEYNFFLAVAFPANQLQIMAYNRVVKDLNGLSQDEFFDRCSSHFTRRPAGKRLYPTTKGDFGIYLGKTWYALSASPSIMAESDLVLRLDVSILQNYILDPILGIKDPRTDTRVDFVGGIRGLNELERRVNSGEMAVAFSLYPTSIHELISIADAGQIMPPKSTWFEPKLRDGLFVHLLDE